MSHQLTFADSEFSTKRRQTRNSLGRNDLLIRTFLSSGIIKGI
ncbi:Truncated ORF1 IS5 [Klebsiella pneumoniae]|nr:hypothetical protein CSB99_1987 [Klebsiella pneumoniae]KDL51542.1 hypothetical protein AD93_03064 [Klebsiella pneumoniae MGH 67]STS74792.1 Truncated ORF1 IS5 [Klebsiella pneumoniae]